MITLCVVLGLYLIVQYRKPGNFNKNIITNYYDYLLLLIIYNIERER